MQQSMATQSAASSSSKCDWGTNFIAYFLLIIGGALGWHHAFLGRQFQAMVWTCTLGGFGVGLLRDLLFIPRYVRESSGEEGACRR